MTLSLKTRQKQKKKGKNKKTQRSFSKLDEVHRRRMGEIFLEHSEVGSDSP
jgi:hypothetical protein